MTSELTPERIAALKAMEQAATEAPWMTGSIDRTLVRSASHLGIACAREPDAAFIAALRNAAPALIAVAEERDAAYTYAKNLCESYVRKYCSPAETWSVLPDLIGVLTQIDNASTVTAELRALLVRAGEALGSVVDSSYTGTGLDSDNLCEAALAEIRRATQELGT